MGGSTVISLRDHFGIQQFPSSERSNLEISFSCLNTWCGSDSPEKFGWFHFEK